LEKENNKQYNTPAEDIQYTSSCLNEEKNKSEVIFGKTKIIDDQKKNKNY